jgi:LysR family glycine cleavage system transcriptional activator
VEVFRLVGMPMSHRAKAMRVDNSVAAVLLAAASGAAIVLRPFAERAIEMLPLHLPFGFELPVEQAHYLLSPAGRSGAKPEALLFREWILAEAATP